MKDVGLLMLPVTTTSPAISLSNNQRAPSPEYWLSPELQIPQSLTQALIPFAPVSNDHTQLLLIPSPI